MLVLTRREGEEIILRLGAEVIVVKVFNLRHDKVGIGIQASENVIINRREIDDRIKRGEKRRA